MRKGSQGTLFIDAGNVGHCLGGCNELNCPVFKNSNFTYSFPLEGVNEAELYHLIM